MHEYFISEIHKIFTVFEFFKVLILILANILVQISFQIHFKH
jgi:hypothetical protein